MSLPAVSLELTGHSPHCYSQHKIQIQLSTRQGKTAKGELTPVSIMGHFSLVGKDGEARLSQYFRYPPASNEYPCDGKRCATDLDPQGKVAERYSALPLRSSPRLLRSTTPSSALGMGETPYPFPTSPGKKPLLFFMMPPNRIIDGATHLSRWTSCSGMMPADGLQCHHLKAAGLFYSIRPYPC